MMKVLLNSRCLATEVTFFSYNCFFEICSKTVKNCTYCQFVRKGLEAFP